MKNRNNKALQLKRDINILQEILSGKIDNYTKLPFSELERAVSEYQEQLNKLSNTTSLAEGGL